MKGRLSLILPIVLGRILNYRAFSVIRINAFVQRSSLRCFALAASLPNVFFWCMATIRLASCCAISASPTPLS